MSCQFAMLLCLKALLSCWYVVLRFQSKKDCKDQETIQSSTTSDPGYHMGKKQNYFVSCLSIVLSLC